MSLGLLRLLFSQHPRLLLLFCLLRSGVPCLHESNSSGLGLLRLPLSLFPKQLLFVRDLNGRLLLELCLVLVGDSGAEIGLQLCLLGQHFFYFLLVFCRYALVISVSLGQEQLQSGDLFGVGLLFSLHIGLELSTDHLIDRLVLLCLSVDTSLLFGCGLSEGLIDSSSKGLLNGSLDSSLHLCLSHSRHRRFHLCLIIVTNNCFNSIPIGVLSTTIPEQICIRVETGRFLGGSIRSKGVLSRSLLREWIIICRSLLCR